MKILNRLFAPKEVKAALGVLDEASCTFDSTHGYHSTAFQLVRGQIEQMILARPDEFVEVVNKGTSPRRWVYTVISNIAGDLVESGKYHIYRGVLNPLGPGEELLRLYDAALDELVGISAIDETYAEKQKSAIRENIKTVG